MDWAGLLSEARVREGRVCRSTDHGQREARRSFERDYDRIVYSMPFRRLQNKTQVHTLPNNDHVRNRLTHSLEASTIARSLGLTIGLWLRDELREPVDPESLAACVQAATLAHDIGNPPFGHAGETAIQRWFQQEAERNELPGEPPWTLTDAQRADFARFNGNAQGFRTLTRHACGYHGGGLQLTCAVLGAFVKYPFVSATSAGERKSPGLFYDDAPAYAAVARELGIPRRRQDEDEWARHPLVFLVEAADDAAYLTADVEDGVELGLLSVDDAMAAFRPYFPHDDAVPRSDWDSLPRFRSRAIGGLIERAVEAFKSTYPSLMKGSHEGPLLGESTRPLRQLAANKLFTSADKLRHELSGCEALEGLLKHFVGATGALRRVATGTDDLRERDLSARYLTADPLHGTPRGVFSGEHLPTDDYEMLHRITDFIAGQTDRYAVSLWDQLRRVAAETPAPDGTPR